MSNTITYEELLNRTLQRVDTGVDTSEGSFLFDAIAPCVTELYEAYLYIDELEKKLEEDTKNLLGWLVSDGYLEFRFAIPTKGLEGGEFHDKFFFRTLHK